MSDDHSRCRAPVDVRRAGSAERLEDSIAVETAVALVYNGISHAVMMATPADLEDFALGFSLTEGILQTPDELYAIEVREEAAGVSVHLEVATQRFMELKQRRRSLAGRTGCGLCGTESLEQAIRPIGRVTAPAVGDDTIQHALEALRWHQPLQRETGATHGAAWCDLDGQVQLAREDVGRHNALDKLIGALAVRDCAMRSGFALVSSRASYEMVQKCVAAGIGCLVAVSAPTSLAIEQARQAGLMLVGFARTGRHVIYHQPASESMPAVQASGG
ncbi:formate dehydrogenase accessory sulfurtransferase FdhD [Halomonas sp. MCCC 1A17488]|uniref:Sulfur carrier protein FdhD n=1 Tax=Billgrantia sulfidoxydans TaxID=2733484 RepID=A0ABX7W999_9GAMM|nr:MULTISPECIES: formate dehydrogenase accessory sulfurtransferase FdhD [Halomonas]MCE8017369.1 formate dehydrogenase accessory sulfurtransferase FdhD [Halomonas sp. MCCC 1A17488]MCG3240702.1 formate dehydrogenase accessory sulfurtransferase FdhD [Halomonas sp. MCCC 1A17488]QPP49459.1 formate dehydrogenase accessory sulfurtransferase FdhD [Halomonas sp. SS10-MC5]QTP56815.1 formate dehydrogenase accessory sulfurtransferase FdhD [Halomonas sulfidoxydans]